MSGAPTLAELWRLAAIHHRALRGFAPAHEALWNIKARRTVWQGLAVLSSTLRRLIDLMAREYVLAPLAPRDETLAPLRCDLPRRPSLRFRLAEAGREPHRRTPNPDRRPTRPS